MEAYQLSKFAAASSVSFAFFGFVCGGMVIDALARRFQSQVSILAGGTLLALILLGVIVYVPYFSYWTLTTLIFLFGVASSSYLAAYALARATRELYLVSSSVVLINMAGPIFSAFAEPLIGKILDWIAHAASNQGAHMFSTHAYQLGLSVLMVYLVLALVMCLFVKKYT